MQWQLSYCNIESNYVFIGSFIEINGWLISTKQTLISLASIGNFKCTAATLGISPVKLTRFVQCAEESCRFSMFERSKTSTTPTTRDQQRLVACKELSIAVFAFDDKLEAIQDKAAEVLRISSGPNWQQAGI